MNSYANNAVAVRIPFWRKDESFAFLNSEVKRLFKTSKRFENLIRQAALALRDGKPVIIEAKPTAKKVVESFVKELAYPEVVKLSFWRKTDEPAVILSEVRKLYKSSPAFARMLESYADKKATGTVVTIKAKPNAKRVLESVLTKLGTFKVAGESNSWQWLYRESNKFTERTNWTRISRARAWAITQDSGLSDCPPSLQKILGYKSGLTWSESKAIDLAAAPRLLTYRPHYETVYRPVEVENAHFVKEHLFDYNSVGELERIELLEARRLEKQLARTSNSSAKQLESLVQSAFTLAKILRCPISLDSSKAMDTSKMLIAKAHEAVKNENFELRLSSFDIEEAKPKLSDFQGEVVSYYDPQQREKMMAEAQLQDNNDALLLEATALLSIEPETDEEQKKYLQDIASFLSQVDAPLYHAEAKGLSKLAWSLRELTLRLENFRSSALDAELKADAEDVELYKDLDAPSILELLEEQVSSIETIAPKGVIAALAQARLEASEMQQRAVLFQNGLSDLVSAI